ncbi:MAG: PHP domain-containing protein [Oscillospiraceae bacterium]|nr:PHP domain-containing protein [Oscillospiraceae bacterium]
MYLTDYHTHSSCSHDGHVTMREMAEAACGLGLAELCITDHCDTLDGEGGWSSAYDWAPVLAQYEEARQALAGRMTVRLGVELGNASSDLTASRAWLNQPALDLVIGSIHCWSMAAGGKDYYFDKYDTPEKCARTMEDYFGQMAELVSAPDCFDVLGHVIYPIRYMNRDGQNPSLAPYEEQIRDIFRRAAGQGRGMEINTYRGRTIEEWKPVLTWFRESGGEIVTIGSDAHQIDQLAGHRAAYELLEACGFRYFACYEKRKPLLRRL